MTKKISVGKIDSIIKACAETDHVTINVCGIDIEVKRTLMAEEFLKLVKEATDFVIRDLGDDERTYFAALEELAFRACVLKYFANFNIDTSLEKLYALCFDTPVFDKVCKCIDPEYYFIVESGVYKQIEFQKQSMLNESKLDQLLNVIISMASAMPEQLGELTDLAKYLNSKDEREIAQGVLEFRKKETDGDS